MVNKKPVLTALQSLTHKVIIKPRNWRIFRGDLVQVINGPEKGKQGKILRIKRKYEKVFIEGINLKSNPLRADEQLGQEEKLNPYPIHCSQINLVDPTINQPTQVKMGYLEDGTRVRISKKTGTIIPVPDYTFLSYEERYKNKVDGPLDTPAQKVLEITYKGEDLPKIKEEFQIYLQKKEEIEKNLVFDDQLIQTNF